MIGDERVGDRLPSMLLACAPPSVMAESRHRATHHPARVQGPRPACIHPYAAIRCENPCILEVRVYIRQSALNGSADSLTFLVRYHLGYERHLQLGTHQSVRFWLVGNEGQN